VADGAIIESGTWSLQSHRDAHLGERPSKLYAAIIEAHGRHRLDRIAFEDASFGSHQASVQAFHNQLRGIIMLAAYNLGPLACIALSIGTVKKFATGSGNAKKDQMIAACRTHFGIDPIDSNEADAIFVAKLAEHEHAAKQRRIKRARTEPKIVQEKLF
jgi:Holliday junction resolvasome RuvABC endonuclease subunit